MVKRLPAMRETQVQSLGGEDPLEKEMASYSSSLAWKFPGQRRLVGYSSCGHKESDTTERLHLGFFRTSPYPLKSEQSRSGLLRDKVLGSPSSTNLHSVPSCSLASLQSLGASVCHQFIIILIKSLVLEKT